MYVRIVVKRVMDVRVTSIDVLLQEVFLLHGMKKIIGSARNVGVENIGSPEKKDGIINPMVQCGSKVHK